MNVLLELYPFLCALLIVEGIVFVRTGMLLFVYWPKWLQSTLLRAGIGFRGSGFGSYTFYCQESPLIVTTKGCYYLKNRTDRPFPFSLLSSFDFIALKDFDKLRVFDRELFFGTTLICTLQTSLMATSLYNRLCALSKKRTVTPADILSPQFSLEPISARLHEVRLTARILSIFQVLFFGLLFFPVPLLYITNMHAFPILIYGIILAVMWGTGVVLLTLSTKKLYGKVDWMSTIHVIVYPLSLCRAVWYMSNYALIDYHPFAIAAVLLKKKQFLAFAQRPYEIVTGCCELELPDDVHELFVHQKQRFLDVARHAGWDESELRVTNALPDATACCFCPVCGSEYLVAMEHCTSCNVKTRKIR